MDDNNKTDGDKPDIELMKRTIHSAVSDAIKHRFRDNQVSDPPQQDSIYSPKPIRVRNFYHLASWLTGDVNYG